MTNKLHNQISNCCSENLRVYTADEGTSCYLCGKCGKPCYAVTNKAWRKRAEEAEKEVERLNAVIKDLEGEKAMTEQNFEDYSEDSQEERARLTASLAAAHEALKEILDDNVHVFIPGSNHFECLRNCVHLDDIPCVKQRSEEALSDPEGKKALERWRKMEALISVSKNNLNMLRYLHLDYTGGPIDEEGNRQIQPIYKHENCTTCDDLIAGEEALESLAAKDGE